MTTNPTIYSQFPEEKAGDRAREEYSFIYEGDGEPREMKLVDARKLNQLAVTFVKYHTSNHNLQQMLAHRRLADRLVRELFPADWEQQQLSFEYDEQLTAEGHDEFLHLLYYTMADFAQIARHSLRLQQLAMTGREVANTRRMTLLRLASLFPVHLMKSR